jgi:hypothetical protein
MALGGNMKIDRLIPVKEIEVKSEVRTEVKTEAEVKNEVKIEDVSVVAEVVTSASAVIIDEPQPQSQSQSQPESQAQPESQYEDIEMDSIKIVFTPSRRKTQKRILISIEGSLTINNVELLYSKVNGVFENYDFVEVTMKSVSEIDLTVVQLFHAIRVSYWPLKKYISINAEFSRDDRKLLNTCGFTEFQTQKTS